VDQDGLNILLGRRALERGLITSEQLRVALAEQARLAASGAPPRALGDVLLDQGSLTGAQLAQLREDPQSRTFLYCACCYKRYPIAEYDPAKTYRCQSCREVLTPAPFTDAGSGAKADAGRAAAAPGLPGAPGATPPVTRLGKYTLLSERGRGGMGVVYEALDSELGRKVALKMLMTSPAQNPAQASQEEERFLREARLSAQLPKHAHVVGVYEAGVLEGRRYLAMELIDGISMAEWRKKGGLTVRPQVALLYDVALAVHHAHEHGVIHRDLKPQNVLVDREGRPHVMDFGLAKSAERDTRLSLTAAGMIVGTPGYMSPEQAQGLRSVDRRTDVYSLGVMLYEILANRMPFEGLTAVDILVKVVKNDVPAPSSVSRMHAPILREKEIENICLKAAAKAPADRYPTARAMAEDLGRWLKGERVRVRPPRRHRRRLWITGGIGALCLAALLVLVNREPPEPDIEPELARAEHLMREKNYTDALLVYGQAILKDPQSARARVGQREAYEAVRVAMAQAESEKTRVDMEKANREATDRRNAAQSAERASEREKLLADQKAAEERARIAEEAARKAREDLEKILAAPAAVPRSGASSQDAWKNAINLLALVDAGRDAVAGSWRRQGTSIVSDSTSRAHLEIPYQPPEEYDLRMVFCRREGEEEVTALLCQRGRPFAVSLGRGATLSVLPPPGGPGGQGGAALQGAVTLVNDRSYLLQVQVRRESVLAMIDGVPVAQWKADLGPLALGPGWKLRNGTLLGIGSHRSPTVFTSAELLQVSGHGRAVAISGISPSSRFPPALRTLVGHASEVKLAALSPDGKLVASAGTDHSIKLWDFATGEERRTLQGHSGMVRFVAFSPDGRVLASAGMDRQIKLWDVATGTERRTLLGHTNGVRSLAFSPDGGILGSGSWDRTIKLWEASTGKEIRTLAGHTDFVKGIAFSADGAQLVSGSQDGTVRVWDLATGWNGRTFAGHVGSIEMVAFLPGGKTVISGGHDNLLKVWDLATGKEVRSFVAHAGPIECLGLSADGRTLATGSWDRSIKLWDTATLKLQKIVGEHDDIVQSVTFTGDGRYLVSASHDRSIRIWDLKSSP
jgi:serine/threonine protein kinase